MVKHGAKVLILALLISVGVYEGTGRAQGSGSAPIATGTDTGSAAGSAALTPAGSDGSASSGSAIGSGSSVVTPPAGSATPTTAPTMTPTSIPDPTVDPIGFVNAIRSLYSFGGWGLAAAGIAAGISYVLAWAGRKNPDGAFGFFGKGRTAVVVGGVGAVLSTAIAAITKTGGQFAWVGFLVAVLGAVLTYWHPGADSQAIADTTARKVAAAAAKA